MSSEERVAVVLVAKSRYAPHHDKFLRTLIDRGISLFCAVGEDGGRWEDALDWMCVELDANGEVPEAFVVTSSHGPDDLREALELAKNWGYDEANPTKVEVVEV